MALQIRVSVPEFSNGINFTDPVILEMADSISLKKTVNSNDESITFSVPVNDPKLQYVTYLRWWECWDTATNLRLNYGPIKEISRTPGETKTISGPGRSAALEDYYKSIQTFYYPINTFLDDLRYENLSSEPRTSTIINKQTSSAYYGLSMRTKDMAIDEQTGYITIGRDTPVQGTIKTNEYWSGIAKADHIVVDLGEEYIISKAKVLLPWWGGETINNNRAYDWMFAHSNNYTVDDSGFTYVFSTDFPNHQVTSPVTGGKALFFGETGYDFDQEYVLPDPISARYWKLSITDTHAWYGSIFSGGVTDEWDWECAETNVYKGNTLPSPTISGGVINPNELTPSSDCHASAVELTLYKKIIGRDTITNLSYKQIQDDNRQITYYHVPTAGEMISTETSTIKKFEPGNFFRNVTITTGASVTVSDEYNTIIYTGGAGTIECPAYTRMLKFDGSSNVQVTQVDTWKGVTDAFSYAGSYSYTDQTNDKATLNFRGVSVKWFATVPAGVTAAQVGVELRSCDSAGTWSSWTPLSNSLFVNGTNTLPTDISAQKVWEITPESLLLADDTTHELRITNLNGGYLSIDAFAGFWSASFQELNEDNARFNLRNPTEVTQIFGEKFSGGSVYQYSRGAGVKQGLHFVGDRVIVYARKGPDYGTIKIGIVKVDLSTGPTLVGIPGTGDGGLEVDLNNPTEIPQVVVFDSKDYFVNPGLPWDHYIVGVYRVDDEGGPIWVDGMGVHEAEGLSVKFLNTSYLDILKATSDALQMEWDVTENGIKVVPRLGTDTDVIFAEGRGTTITINDVQDVGQVATQLISSGADIDGLPMSAVVEDKNTRAVIGRTIQRLYDLRNTADYFTLIGASRAELVRRRRPQSRVTITRVGTLEVDYGDSFIVKTPDLNERMRATSIQRNQSATDGTVWTLECESWPQIP